MVARKGSDMIIDRLENWETYFESLVWRKAFEYLMTLEADVADGRVSLIGDDMFAVVMSYETRERQAAVLETHDKYIDIQYTLDGAEGMDWYRRDGLTVSEPYDAAKDRTFYLPTGEPGGHVIVSTGMFAVFFAGDAHMPQLVVGDAPQRVKKVVIKINADLFRS